MTRQIEIHIHLDGPRSITKNLPPDWDTWSVGEKEGFLYNAKMELVDGSVDWTVLGLGDDD